MHDRLQARLGALGAALALCALDAHAQTGSVTLSWTPPTQYADGTPLKGLGGYRVYWGTAPGALTQSAFVTDPGVVTYVVQPLAAGQWYFGVTAFDVGLGSESALSNIASKTIGAEPLTLPGPVDVLNLTWAETPDIQPWRHGWSFRLTGNYVTDAAGDTYSIGEPYPTQRMSGMDVLTFGWEQVQSNGWEFRDRGTSNAPLVGLTQVPSYAAYAARTFRVELPGPGQYRVRLAAGDRAYDNRAYFEILDGTDVLLAVPDTAVPTGRFLDASRTLRTLSNWSSSNGAATLTFKTTTARVVLKRPATTASVLSYISFERVLP